MRTLRRLVLAAAALLPAAAQAQQASIEPSAAQRCLQLADGKTDGPEYPFELMKLGRSGRVVVLLTFTKADARPAVQVLEREGEEEFADVIERHVRRLRVPCLRPDEGQATLRQEYRFRPDEHPVSALDTHPETDRQQRLSACLMHVSGRHEPAYPWRAGREDVQGRVLLRLRFDAPDRPPQAQVLARPRADLLARAAAEFAAGYRLPCIEGGPVRLSLQYNYVFQGEAYGFRKATLPQIVGSMKNIRLQRVFFNLDTMGCPFDVTFTYWQPLAPNVVTAHGPPDGRRAALLQWLRDAELALRESQLDALFGDTVGFTVPCGKIDLQPEEKS